MLRFVMFVSFLSGIDAPDYRVRVESERGLETWIFTANLPMTEPPNLSPQQRTTWKRIQSRYRDVTPPELGDIAGWDSEEWWGLYARVTGNRKTDFGWFFGVMPSPDDVLEMRRLWVQDQFDRGLTRTEVQCLIWVMRQSVPAESVTDP